MVYFINYEKHEILNTTYYESNIIPEYVKYLILSNISYNIEDLIYPPNLKELEIISNIKLENLPELPNSLEILSMEYNCNQSLSKLPCSLKMLILGNNYNKILPKLPNHLKRLLIYNKNYKFYVELPDNLREIACECFEVLVDSSGELKLPKSIKIISFHGKNIQKYIVNILSYYNLIYISIRPYIQYYSLFKGYYIKNEYNRKIKRKNLIDYVMDLN